MDDHFDTSGVFEISKFDISKFACIQETADKLAHEVSLVVYSHAGGVGDKPSPP